MSKWSIFLNESGYCPSERGTGNRPCDMGLPCGACHNDKLLEEEFNRVKDDIDESEYCKCCGHKLAEHEISKGYCQQCDEFEW